ncbi:MAG: restriction endonuclease subunit S [Gammaproteobacteria bacterium]|nr:restriction endonuclease subunit S [Gammaproteobacteria bacterium]
MVPDGWKTHTISEIFHKISKPVDVDKTAFYREIGIRSHGKGIFHKGKVLGNVLGNKRVFYIESDCFVVNIVFAWEQAVAKTSQAEDGMIASHRFPMFKPKKNQCDVDFILYFFKSKRGKFLLELASPGGAGRNKTLGQYDFSRLKLLLPPINEQKKIAEILSTWDDAIAANEDLLANSRQRKKALMQKLLTGRTRLPGFEGAYEKVTLSDVCQINPSRFQHASSETVTFLKMEDVSGEGRIIFSNKRKYEEVTTGFTSFIDGDVLVAKITPCFENGKRCLVKGMDNGFGYGSTEFHVIRPGPSILSEIVFAIVGSQRFRALGEANMQGSAGQKRVPADFISCFKFLLPELCEQKAIASILTTADEEIEALEQRINNLKTQKKALMQQLLTGKRRVKLN